MLGGTSTCLFVPYRIQRASHWSTAIFDGNPQAVSLNIEANYASKMATSSDGVPWRVVWSDRWESEMGGRVTPDESSTDERSDQAVLLSGFYVFKRPESASWQHPLPREQIPVQTSQDFTAHSQFSGGSQNAASSGASTSSGFANRSGGAQDDSEMVDGTAISTDPEEVWSNLVVHCLGLNILDFAVLQPRFGDSKLHFCGD